MTEGRSNPRNRSEWSLLRGCFFLALMFLAPALFAQDAPQGPIAPPRDHHVVRLSNEPEPPAPPSLPEAEIIRRFSQKEDDYLAMLTQFSYKKTFRIVEFGPVGR